MTVLRRVPAILAALAGLMVWIACEIAAPEGDVPPQFAGFLAASRNGRGLVFHITAVDPA